MARPKSPVTRDQQLNISLTAAEMTLVKARAEVAGLRPSAFARLRLLSSTAELDRRAREGSGAQRLVYAQLGRLGNNLNQIVRHMHARKELAPPTLAPLLEDIRQIVTRDRGDGA